MANTKRLVGTFSKEYWIGLGSRLGRIKLLLSEGVVEKLLTITNAPLTEDRTIIFPDKSGFVAVGDANGFKIPLGMKISWVASESVNTVGDSRMYADENGFYLEYISSVDAETGEATWTYLIQELISPN